MINLEMWLREDDVSILADLAHKTGVPVSKLAQDCMLTEAKNRLEKLPLK
jgi:hypothetical protein